MFVSESLGEKSPSGFDICLLWIEVECHSREKTPPIMGSRTTAAPEKEEVGFCTKSTVTLLPTSQRDSCKTCQPLVNIPEPLKTCAGDGFLEGWAKNAQTYEPNTKLIPWRAHVLVLTLICLPLLPWLLGNMSLSSYRDSESSTEELLPGRARWSQFICSFTATGCTFFYASVVCIFIMVKPPNM